MSFFTTTVAIFYVLLFVLSLCSLTSAASTELMEVPHITEYIMSALLQFDGVDYNDGGQNKARVKRDGTGKFSEAASMTPMKVMQLFFTNVRNLFTTDPIGGVHPMSRNVPKPIVQLIKNTIIKKLFPNLSPDH